MIYIIVGIPCSGKTTARNYLEQLGMMGFEASDMLAEAKLDSGTDSLEMLFLRFGRDYVARRIQKKFPPDGHIIISGFRTPEELQYIIVRAPTITIGINSSIDCCYRRSQARGRIVDAGDYLAFQNRVKADLDLGLSEVFEHFIDSWIDNNRNDLEEFYRNLEQTVKKYGM